MHSAYDMMYLAANPFISAYVQSDGFGKAIFWGLFILSALCWIVILYKGWQYWAVHKLSLQFSDAFKGADGDPLALQFTRPTMPHIGELPHPLFDIYRAVKQQTLQLIGRNGKALLSSGDLELVDSQVMTSMSSAIKKLEKHLFVLSTIVTLAPFLGLLGTVWGILLTFSELHKGVNNAAMLAGLSLALATTVVGLLVAIPALVGYSYLKNKSRELHHNMEEFSHALVAAIELQYRKE